MTNGQTFTVLNVTFHCHIVEDGQRYEWITRDNLRAVGRIVGGPTCWARVGNRTSKNTFPNLRSAMHAAAREAVRAAA